MKRSTHLALGAAAVAPLALTTEPILAASCVWFGLAGSVMPDWLDFRSEFRQPLRLKHRGVSHSILTLLVCTGATWLLATLLLQRVLTWFEPGPGPSEVSETVALSLAIGFASHLLADACTPAGISPFLPLSASRWWLLPRRLRGRTGGPLDTATRWVALAAVAFALVVAAGSWLDLPV